MARPGPSAPCGSAALCPPPSATTRSAPEAGPSVTPRGAQRPRAARRTSRLSSETKRPLVLLASCAGTAVASGQYWGPAGVASRPGGCIARDAARNGRGGGRGRAATSTPLRDADSAVERATADSGVAGRACSGTTTATSQGGRLRTASTRGGGRYASREARLGSASPPRERGPASGARGARTFPSAASASRRRRRSRAASARRVSTSVHRFSTWGRPPAALTST
jgi:hypothetical protein